MDAAKQFTSIRCSIVACIQNVCSAIYYHIKATIDAHPEIKEGHSIWRESPDGVQNVADGALIPMLVKSIQELSAQNAALTARIETLEG